MEDLAQETGYCAEQAVAVLALTSRAARLQTNIKWTGIALRSAGAVPVGRFPNMMMPAVRLVLEDPAKIPICVSGPKIEAFYQAIMGDREAVVLDRWAFYAAGYRSRRAPDPGPTWRSFADAYRRAAELVGLAARDFQAIVWIAAREGMDSPGKHRLGSGIPEKEI